MASFLRDAVRSPFAAMDGLVDLVSVDTRAENNANRIFCSIHDEILWSNQPEAAMRILPRQVEAFRAVMRAGGVTAAAGELNVTQPAVSRLLRDFEAETGLLLFDREGNRLVPRQEAHTLWSEIERVWVGLDHVGRTAENIRLGRGHTLRVGAVAALTGLCMDGVVADFLAEAPETVPTFETESSGRVAELVALQYYDVGLVYLHGGWGNVRTETLATVEAVAVLPNGHPHTKLATITPEDLDGEALVLPGRRTPLRIGFEASIESRMRRSTRVIEASLHHCCRLVAQGLGIGIVDPITAREFEGRLVCRPFRPALPVVYGAVFAHGPVRNHLAPIFVAAVRRVLDEVAGTSPTFPADRRQPPEK